MAKKETKTKLDHVVAMLTELGAATDSLLNEAGEYDVSAIAETAYGLEVDGLEALDAYDADAAEWIQSAAAAYEEEAEIPALEGAAGGADEEEAEDEDEEEAAEDQAEDETEDADEEPAAKAPAKKSKSKAKAASAAKPKPKADKPAKTTGSGRAENGANTAFLRQMVKDAKAGKAQGFDEVFERANGSGDLNEKSCRTMYWIATNVINAMVDLKVVDIPKIERQRRKVKPKDDAPAKPATKKAAPAKAPAKKSPTKKVAKKSPAKPAAKKSKKKAAAKK